MRVSKKFMAWVLALAMVIPSNAVAWAAQEGTEDLPETGQAVVLEEDAGLEETEEPEEAEALKEAVTDKEESVNEELPKEQETIENAAGTDTASGNDWVEIDQIEGSTDISAKGFGIRHLDKDGNVLSERYWTRDQMKALAEKYEKRPYYYTFGCGMLGYPSIAKGEGVQLTDLLAEAGITFGEGQKLMLRATDVLAREMEVGTVSWRTGKIDFASDAKKQEWEAALADISQASGHSAYYTNFTYEYLMGLERYSFARAMSEAMVKDPNLTQAGLYSDPDVIGKGKAGGVVSPLLCFGFGQKYANEITAASDMENIPLTCADTYRFCFGQALDADGNISSANTRMQTAYNVFGLDIVDTEDISLITEGSYHAKGKIKIKAEAPKTSGDAGTFFDNVNKVTLTGEDGVVRDIPRDGGYTTGYERVGSEWVYYLELDESVIQEPGTYQIAVDAATFNTATGTLEVKEAEAPQIIGFAVTNREHSDADEEKNQTIVATVTFDHRIQASENAADDLEILIAGGNVRETPREITCAVDPEDKTKLVITMTSTDWVAVYNGLLNISAAETGIKNIKSEDGERLAVWTDLETYIPIGIALTNRQTAGTAEACASTEVTVAHKANMRGMYHVQVLKNGQPIGSRLTSHAHLFYTSITEASIAQAVAKLIDEAEDIPYGAVYNEGETRFTVTAETPAEGERITVQMFEDNADGRTVDPLLEVAAAAGEQALEGTQGDTAKLQAAIQAARALIGTSPSLKEQADAKAAIKAEIAALSKEPARPPVTPPVTPQEPPVTPVRPTATPTRPSLPAVGKKLTDAKSKAIYKVTKKGKTVQYTGTTDKKATSVAIPSTIKVNGTTYQVTSIASQAFKGNKKIKKITIPDRITAIGSQAFQGCTALTTVTVGKNVNSIGKQAFYNCKKLTKVVLKSTKLTASKVGSQAFGKAGCSNYKKLKVQVPSKKLKNYTQVLRKKGLSKKTTVKKI